LGAAGLGMQAFGGIMAGRAAKRAGKAEAERLEYNADIADLQAADALQRGVDAAGKQRAVTRQVIGTQRAGFAGQNVDVNVGSAVDVQADAALLGEHDAQQITANAEREAWGYRVEAVDRRLAARNARQNGNAAGNAAYFQTAGTLMTGTGLLAEKYGWPPPKPTSTPSTPRYTVNW
jgi:hypothetical protein